MNEPGAGAKGSSPSRQCAPAALWCYRILAAVLAPLLFLTVLEIALRVAHVGYSTKFFVPNEGGQGYTTNLKFGWRFFPPRIARWPSPQVLPARKGKDAYRIFLLGSSAAYGTPSDLYGFSRILGVMLRERFPRTKFEIVNAAMTAINSHILAPIARDCAAMEPNLLIIYMGNNEVIGPYGAGSVFGRYSPSLRMIRAHLWLKSTAVVRMFYSLFDWGGNLWGKAGSWEGMAAFMEHLVTADDPRLQWVYSHCRRNLEDICRAASKAGAQTIGCTVAVNLRDCPPFVSEHRADLSAEDRAAFDADFQRGRNLLDQRQWDGAEAAFKACLQRDDHFADAHYFLAKTLEAAGRERDTAREHFIEARDWDALRFRADTRINETIRDVLSNSRIPNVHLLDVERKLGEASQSTLGIPGDEFFYEHVHFRFPGNYQVASFLFREIEPLVARSLKQETNPSFALPSLEFCKEQLGYTLIEEAFWDRFMLQDMMDKPPFTHQLDHERRHAEEVDAFNAKYANRMDEKTQRHALDVSRRAAAARPDDLYLQKALLNHYDLLKMTNDAIRQLEAIVEVIPTDYITLSQLAGAYMRRGDDAEAEKLFLRAIAIDPYYYVAQHNIAVLRQRRSTAPEVKPSAQRTPSPSTPPRP
jgi:tetratricopeptide (TPR) repeat protein